MEQQQFKVSFSIGTKLLVSLVTLLFISIAFLDFSTIVLLEKDKRAYTYQAQSTEAVLVGREFTNIAKHTFDTIRLSLASLEPTKPVTPQQTRALQSVLDNQNEIFAIGIYLFKPDTIETQTVALSTKEELMKSYELKPENLVLPQDLLKLGVPDLMKESFAFLNPSKVGSPPMLAVLLADLSLKSNPTGVPVGIAFISLKDFAKEVKASQLTVLNREGWVLFDTNPTSFFNKKNIADDPLYESATTSQVATGAKEYEFEETRYLGSYYKPGMELIVLTKSEWRKVMSATYALMEKFILLGCMVIGAAIIFAILFAKTITAPIKRLYEATYTVASGNFDISVESKSRDEVGALTNAFVVMSAKIRELIAEMIKKTQLENELAIASTVQQNLIPPNQFDADFISIRSHYQAAAVCGGDWWGFFGVGKKVSVMIADATGHGLPSALITASARSCFSVMHKIAQEDPEFTFSPGAMLAHANRVVHDAASGKIMMTFFVGVLDFEAKTLTYSSAGHNPPWLFKNDGGRFTLKSLVSVGPRLGEARDVEPFQEQRVSIDPDDILFLYTDGLMEGKNGAGEMYGKKRTRKVVEASLMSGPEAVVKALMDDFMTHNEGKLLDDDVTLAVARLKPQALMNGNA
jgi:phosphoserine phosphatase RsbU/P